MWPMVFVSILEPAKLALHDAMLAQDVTNIDLARHIDEKAVRRLLDPLHGYKIEAVEAALRHLGMRALVEYQVLPAAMRCHQDGVG